MRNQRKRGICCLISEAQIKQWYEVDRLSQSQIAVLLNVSPSTVYLRLKRAGVKLRSKREAGRVLVDRRWPTVHKSTLKKLYEDDGLSVRAVAALLGVPATRVRDLMKRYEMPLRRSSYSAYAESRYEILVDEASLVADYQEHNMSVRSLMRKYGMGDRWIRKTLRKHGVVLRHSNQYTNSCPKAA